LEQTIYEALFASEMICEMTEGQVHEAGHDFSDDII